MSKCKIWHTLLSCVRVSKLQGAEMEDEGSVLKYMTKSEIEEQCSSLLIMTQRFFFVSLFLPQNIFETYAKINILPYSNKKEQT